MYKQPDLVKKLAVSVGKNSLLKFFLKPLYTHYIFSLNNRRKKVFKKNGLHVLEVFDKCMNEYDIPYSLAFGTMLGAVREHGFIQHDYDIDVVVWSEDYKDSIRDYLRSNGFSHVHTLLVDEGKSGREETYRLNGVAIDIFFIYPPIDDYPYCCDFLSCLGSVSFKDSMKKFGYIIPRRLQLPWKKEFQRVRFENLMLPITTNAAEVLSFRYGEDYMTPNPNWHYTDANVYTVVWKEKKGIML